MDKKNVIYHLKIIATWAALGKDSAYNDIESNRCEDVGRWSIDAINLLHEQDSIIRTLQSNQYNNLTEKEIPKEPKNEVFWSLCEVCDHMVERSDKYCRHCGQKLKWD